MNSQILFYLLIGLVVGAMIGIMFSSFLSPKLRRYNALKKELNTTKQQMANQKQMLVKHFSHSAELLDKMSKDFRHLYQHIAENSTSLLIDVDMSDPNYVITDFALKDNDHFDNQELKEQPRDYPCDPSGLLKKEKNHKR